MIFFLLYLGNNRKFTHVTIAHCTKVDHPCPFSKLLSRTATNRTNGHAQKIPERKLLIQISWGLTLIKKYHCIFFKMLKKRKKENSLSKSNLFVWVFVLFLFFFWFFCSSMMLFLKEENGSSYCTNLKLGKEVWKNFDIASHFFSKGMCKNESEIFPLWSNHHLWAKFSLEFWNLKSSAKIDIWVLSDIILARERKEKNPSISI